MQLSDEPVLNKILSKQKHSYQISDYEINDVIMDVANETNINYPTDFTEYERKRDMKYYVVEKFRKCVEEYNMTAHEVLFEISKLEIATGGTYNRKMLRKILYAICYSINNINDTVPEVCAQAEVNHSTFNNKFKSVNKHLDTILAKRGEINNA